MFFSIFFFNILFPLQTKNVQDVTQRFAFDSLVQEGTNTYFYQMFD